MPTIYARGIPDELDTWLEERARYLGMSKSALVRLILASAREEAWPDRRFSAETRKSPAG